MYRPPFTCTIWPVTYPLIGESSNALRGPFDTTVSMLGVSTNALCRGKINGPLRALRVELVISLLPGCRWFGEIPCSIGRRLVDLEHFEVIRA